MYDYSCEEFPFFKVNPHAYPSKAQQVSQSEDQCYVILPSWRLVITSGGINGLCRLLFVQLHFIENYLRESDPGFDNLCAGDQFAMKEALYVEVNRWPLAALSLTRNKSITGKSFWGKTGTDRMFFEYRFSLASHFFWGLWSIIQARLSTIKFGYLVSFQILFC